MGVVAPATNNLAIIETDGRLSILKKSQFQPLTAGDMALKGQPAVKSRMVGNELIIDGKVIDDNIRKAGIERSKLTEYLNSQGVKDVSDVVLATLNPQGKIYIDIKKDK